MSRLLACRQRCSCPLLSLFGLAFDCFGRPWISLGSSAVVVGASVLPRILPIRHHELGGGPVNLYTTIIFWQHVRLGDVSDVHFSILLSLGAPFLLCVTIINILLSHLMAVGHVCMLISAVMVVVVLDVDYCWSVVHVHVADVVGLVLASATSSSCVLLCLDGSFMVVV